MFDKIKNYMKERKVMDRIKHQAKMEAIAQSKEDMVQAYIDKIKNTNKSGSNFLSKIAKEFEHAGENMGKNMDKMFTNTNTKQNFGFGNEKSNDMFNQDKINKMLGIKKEEKDKPKHKHENSNGYKNKIEALKNRRKGQRTIYDKKEDKFYNVY